MADNQLDSIGKQATKNVIKDVNKNIKQGNFKILEDKANLFLRKIQNIQQISNNDLTNSVTINDIYNLMREKNSVRQELIKYQFEFQKAFNEFLGRTINLIWIDYNGDICFAKELTAKQIYKQSDKDGSLSISALSKSASVKKFNNFLSKLGDRGQKIKNHLNNYRQLYNEIQKRWKNNHYKAGSNSTWYDYKIDDKYIFRDTFYWEDSYSKEPGPAKNRYSHSKKINRGHIGQTYINLSMLENPHNEVPENNQQEDTIGKYWKFMQSHNLNNTPGILGGDVELQGYKLNGIIQQFAVKQGSANIANIGPYIKMALFIKNFSMEINNGKITVEDIMGNFNKLSARILNDSKIYANKQLRSQLQDVFK